MSFIFRCLAERGSNRGLNSSSSFPALNGVEDLTVGATQSDREQTGVDSFA